MYWNIRLDKCVEYKLVCVVKMSSISPGKAVRKKKVLEKDSFGKQMIKLIVIEYPASLEDSMHKIYLHF